jgi:tetratricopeptide (TPR) repeat protein
VLSRFLSVSNLRRHVICPNKHIHRYLLPVVVMLLMGLWSCVSMAPGPENKRWSCDHGADKAVTDGDWEQALSGHQAFLAANPGNCLAIYHLGYIWGRLGDREMEIEQFERAAACGYDIDDQLHFNLGMAYAEADRMTSAISALERAVTLNPQNAENHFGLGLTALSAGQPDLARRALTRAVEVDPRHWDARIELARMDLDQGRLELARIQLDAVQKGAPDHEALQALWGTYRDRRITAFDSEKK